MKKVLIHLLFFLFLMSCTASQEGEEGELLFIEPTVEDGFHYPYFLFIPKQVSRVNRSFLIIEPNNSGFIEDDLEKHIESAKLTATKDFYLGNYLASHLKYPLLVPVFPRPETEWHIYTHDLDRDVMLQKGNSLERIDKQLVRMFEDARSRLDNKNIPTENQFLLTGFSASGSFANRFTILHPDQVFAVAAGGTSGLLMLPIDSLDNERLNYPIGTGDLKEIINEEFSKKAFLNTPQMYFYGKLDSNDALPYNDAFDRLEREQVYELIGEEMYPERWEKCKTIYREQQVNALLKTYENVGHGHPEQVKKDVLAFFEATLKKAGY